MPQYSKDNIFHKIIHGEIETNKIYEDEYVIAINDIYPVAEFHILVIPKGDYISFDDFIDQATNEEIARFFKTVKKIVTSLGIDQTGYKLIMNHKESFGQTIFHMHLHILGGKILKEIKG